MMKSMPILYSVNFLVAACFFLSAPTALSETLIEIPGHPIKLRYEPQTIELEMEKNTDDSDQCDEISRKIKNFFDECKGNQNDSEECIRLHSDLNALSKIPEEKYLEYSISKIADLIDSKNNSSYQIDIRSPSFIRVLVESLSSDIQFVKDNEFIKMANALEIDPNQSFVKITESKFKVVNRLYGCAFESGGVLVKSAGNALFYASITTEKNNEEDEKHVSILTRVRNKALELASSQYSHKYKYRSLGTDVGRTIRQSGYALKPEQLEEMALGALRVIMVDRDSQFNLRNPEIKTDRYLSDVLSKPFSSKNLDFKPVFKIKEETR
jgi:hypothetical protein